jgi:uncharacterized membrane protein
MLKGNKGIFFSFLFGLSFVLYVWFGNEIRVDLLTQEDGLVEYLSAIFYLIGMILAINSIFKNKKLIVFSIIWAVLCFVFLGEETSWFQRILNYSVPAIEQMNAQKEFNLHNLELEIFKGDRLFVDGKLTRTGVINFFKSTQNIFRLGFFGFFIVLPLLTHNGKIRNILVKWGYIKPSSKFILLMMVVLILSFVLAVLLPEKIKMAMAETREMLYAFYIFLYIWMYYYSYKKIETV